MDVESMDLSAIPPIEDMSVKNELKKGEKRIQACRCALRDNHSGVIFGNPFAK